jgi:hypothetical protein
MRFGALRTKRRPVLCPSIEFGNSKISANIHRNEDTDLAFGFDRTLGAGLILGRRGGGRAGRGRDRGAGRLGFATSSSAQAAYVVADGGEGAAYRRPGRAAATARSRGLAAWRTGAGAGDPEQRFYSEVSLSPPQSGRIETS